MSARHFYVALLCLAWIIPGLIGHDPWKPDDGFTFGVVYEILRGGSWVVPKLAGEVFLEEPPLYYLVSAASATLFSPLLQLHDGARLASGFFMALTFLFCGLAGRELHGNGRGALAALLLLGCLGLVAHSHQIITDIVPLAGFAMAYYALALTLRRPIAGGAWLGLALGLVFLSQGIFETALIMLITALLPVVSAAWRHRNILKAAGVALIIALPCFIVWPLLLYSQAPELLNVWLKSDMASQWVSSQPQWIYYLRILPWYAWPLWAVCLWTLWCLRRNGVRGHQYGTPAVALPLTGFVVTLVALTAGGSAREIYALPMLPALALLALPGMQNLRRGAANAWFWFGMMGGTFFIIVLWFYWSGLELGMPARLHAHLHRIQPGYTPGFKWLPFTLAALYTCAWFVLLAKLKRSPERPAIVWAAGVTVIWGLIAILFVGWIDTGKSYRSTFVTMQQKMPAKYQCVASRGLGETQRAVLHYVTNIVTERTEVSGKRRDCDLLLVQEGVAEKGAGGWKKIWEGRRPSDKVERYRLYQRISFAAPR